MGKRASRLSSSSQLSKADFEGLIKLKDIRIGTVRMTSWWDYGYASLFLNDLRRCMTGGPSRANRSFVAMLY